MPELITSWNPASSVLIMFFGFCFTLVGRIVWSWLEGLKNNNTSCNEHPECYETVTILKGEVSELKKDMKEVQESIKAINDLKVSFAKSEMHLSNISKSVEKLDSYLEKNLDEVFTRLRKLEAEAKQ